MSSSIDPSLQKLIDIFGFKKDEGASLLHPDFYRLLDAINPESPRCNREFTEQNAEAMAHLIQAELAKYGKTTHKAVFPPENLHLFYAEVIRGMVYAAEHYGDKSRIKEIVDFQARPNPLNKSEILGSCHQRPQGIVITVYPRLASMCNTAIQFEKYTSNPAPRHYPDPKIPGKFFNGLEMAFLTGVEEAVHAQQMLEGRFKVEYKMDEAGTKVYFDSECEQEAAQISQKAVQELAMGSQKKEELDVPQTPATDKQAYRASDNAQTPKQRAEQRKKKRAEEKRQR